MWSVTLIVILFCLTSPLEAKSAIKSSLFTTSTTHQPAVGVKTNESGLFNNPDNEFTLIKDNQPGKLNLVDDKRTPVNNQLQTGNYQQSKDGQVNSLRSSNNFAINGNINQQQGLGQLHVPGLQGYFQNQLLPLSSQSQSAKYREVEEIIPTNEVDQKSREPEISGRQPPRGGGGGPVIPPHEPESDQIDPNTPGYSGPPQPSGPSPGQPPFPGSPNFPREIPSTPNSPPNLFPPQQQPGVIVASLPPTTESDVENQPQPPSSLSPYYPTSPLYPDTFQHPPQPLQPPTSIQFPLPPSPPPASVYPSYSPPSWLTNFYTPSTNFYSNYPFNQPLISTYSTHLSPNLKSSYLIPRNLIPIESSQLTSVGSYLDSNLATHTHYNPLYFNHGQQTHLITDINQQPQLINVNPVVNPYLPPTKGGETIESTTTTTTTESPTEGFKESEIDDTERISNI